MNKADWIEAIVVAGLRTVAVTAWFVAAYAVVIHLAESLYQFDPNYLATFLFYRLLRPVLLVVLGALLWFFAPRFGRIAVPAQLK